MKACGMRCRLGRNPTVLKRNAIPIHEGYNPSLRRARFQFYHSVMKDDKALICSALRRPPEVPDATIRFGSIPGES
jgi:hypothetical protein